jgi:hypothetical protein
VVRSLREDAVREQARRLVRASRFDRDVVMLRALELR